MSYDQFIASLCVWREARDQPMDAKKAVWRVIYNRANDHAKRWPTSIVRVVIQPRQFSSFNLGDPNSALYPSDANALDWAAWQDCMAAVSDSVSPDPTSGANHYFSGDNAPVWADETRLTCQIGAFRFYKL